MTTGWLDAMEYKLDVILNAIEECKDDWFIFADCDVQFLHPFIEDITNELKDNDIVCQEDKGSLCAGFFACKSNERTALLFKKIKSDFRYLVNDQAALNTYKQMVKYKLLCNKKYYTIGNVFTNVDGTSNWDNQTDIIPPKEILVHHANYVKGTKNKVKLLSLIKNATQ
jgi:hypothetical protein